MSVKQTTHCRRRDLIQITIETDVSKNNHTWRTLRYGVTNPEGENPSQLLFWMAAYLSFCLDRQETVACVMSVLHTYMTQFTARTERRR
jgi:hypothetical protein